ncbi:MAG TPA: ankyrin repeat domain-containing protein [Gemmatimonadaceae bacterium]|jgi:ankyrin repeat protein
MSRKITSRSSVENLKREAKRWLKALRDNDAEARARLARVVANASASPTLRDMQHALALEYGHSGWTSLVAAVESQPSADVANPDLIGLFVAAQNADLSRIRELLDAHPDFIDVRARLDEQSGQRTALHYGNHHYDVVKLLLERGADPNIRDEGDNAYPLHFVAERLELSTVQLLIEHDADPIGEGDMHDLGVIGWATCFNPAYLRITPEQRVERRRAIVDYLLANGGRHNMLSAVTMDAVDEIRAIIVAQPDQLERQMDAVNRRRRPLHLAVVEKRGKALKTLIDLGADLEAKDAAGLTALDQAALSAERELADLLLSRGATLTLPSALALDRDVDRLLAEDPNAIRPGGKWATLIIRAAEQRDTRMLETLIRHGANVNTRDETTTSVDSTPGYTALHAAAFNGNRTAVELLLAHGASVTAREGRYSGTPAGWAMYAKHPEIADRILAGPIDMFDAIINHRVGRLREIFDRDPGALNKRMHRLLAVEPKPNDWTKAWWTPLAMAVTHGYADAVGELIALGADVEVRDPTGRSLREIALTEGHAETAALLEQEERSRIAPTPPAENETRDQLIARFLSNACPDHHVRGGAAHIVARQTASSLLDQHPGIAHHDLYTAIVCGELGEVKRILADDPEAARRKGGPKGSRGGQSETFVMGATGASHPRWEPILYLCFTRLDNAASTDNAVAIARLLLDNGADPNAYFLAGDSRYSPLVGVIGGGEENRPAHPHRDELVRLLLERGAQPYDIQVLYNIHFNDHVLWYLKAIHKQTITDGRTADWQNPEWPMLDMGGYGSGARFILAHAIDFNDLELAAWALDHGASANAKPPEHRRAEQRSLYEEATRRGFMEMAALLERHGAMRPDPEVEPAQAFTDACLRLDTPAARALLEAHPELLQSPGALHAAASLDRADAVALILDLGASPNIPNPQSGNQLALHAGAWMNAHDAVRVLIDRGGDYDRREDNYGATPLGFAIYGNKTRAIEVLKHYGHDVWNLALVGSVDQLRAALSAKPSLARAAWPGEEITALMRLPGNADTALDVARVLLEHGADPTHRNSDGLTAIDLAERRGLTKVAAFLRTSSS